MKNEQTPLVHTTSPPEREQTVSKGTLVASCYLSIVAIGLIIVCYLSQDKVGGYELLGSAVSAEDQLRALQLDGNIYFPSDETRFTKASTVWNKLSLLLSAPAAVIEAESEQDVQQAVQLLVSLNVPFTIKSGGHNKAALSYPQSGGVMLSVSKLNSVQIHEYDNARAVATVGPAVHSPQLLRESLPRGYGAILGICPTVALSGFALNGGYGFLSRKHGLGAENILSSRIVLNSGDVVVANKTSHPDLFWALQGAGGGSFGVVTELTYELHPAQQDNLYGFLWIERQDTAEFLHALHSLDLNGTLPREMMSIVELWGIPSTDNFPQPVYADAARDLKDPIGLVLMWMGRNHQVGTDFFENVLAKLVPRSRLNYEESRWVQDAVRSETTAADSNYVACYTGFMTHNIASNKETLEHVVNTLYSISHQFAPYTHPDLELWGGAINDIPSNATAFAHRDVIFNVGVLVYVPTATADAVQVFDSICAHLDEEWRTKMAPHLAGAYGNYQMASLSDDEYPNLYWGRNLKRLQAVKNRYDPSNIFTYSQGIPSVQ